MSAGPLGSIQSERGRLYEDPETGQKYPSVTTILGVLNKPFLVPWAAKMVAERAVADISGLYQRIRTDGQESARKWLSRAHRDSSSKAAVRGSDLHDLAERHDKGEEIIHDLISPEVAQMLSHYQQFIKDCDVEIIFSEVSLVNRTIGYAGAADLIAHVPGISVQTSRPLPLILDIKTSPKGPYASWALQLAAYANAELMMAKDPATGEVSTRHVPDVRKTHGAVVRITPDGYELIQADLSGKFEQFRLLHNVWREDMDNTADVFEVTAKGEASAEIDLVADRLRTARSRAELTIRWKQAEAAGELDPEIHTPIAQMRAQEIDKAA